MAILNITPDSFFDGGVLTDARAAAARAEQAVAEGADILDIGGESTRPGAARVPADEQRSRVIPAIAAIRRAGGALAVPISVDTTHAPVAEAALDAGADAINDVSAGTEDARMLGVAARRRAGLILMHRLRPPDQDSYSDRYASAPNDSPRAVAPPDYAREGGVIAAVRSFLAARSAAALEAGAARESIVLDPGLGFGKTVDQNLELIRRTGELCALGFPILSAISRKSFTGAWAGLKNSPPSDRLAPSIALTLEHRRAGASIFRVHDVSETLHALRRDAFQAACEEP